MIDTGSESPNDFLQPGAEAVRPRTLSGPARLSCSLTSDSCVHPTDVLVFTVSSRPRVFAEGLPCVPSVRSCSCRGVNGLVASSHECCDDDENDENAKRYQFSCIHTQLPNADLRQTT